jgi:DNA-binding response OmpR family regulator
VTADNILLIEDDERIGPSLVRALQGNGFEVDWTRSGEDGIASGGVRRPDLVLLDLGLPDLDGLDVCRRLHSLDPTIDIIMLTARDEELDVVVGLDAGRLTTSALNVTVTVSASGAAVQTATVKKDAGGPEEAD